MTRPLPSARPQLKAAGSRPWLRCVAALLLALLLAALPPLARSLQALVLLARLTGLHALDGLAEHLLAPIEESELQLSAAGSTLRARRYAPREQSGAHGALLLLHGVHPRGIDESHLVGFARMLAAGGLDVVTPELPELLRYRLDSTTIAQIRGASQAHAELSRSRAVGLIGISFAGGLALLAAAEQASDRPIGFVVAVGGHADLIRLTQYYAGAPVRGPHGEPVDVAPHPYGARVMIREHLDRFFEPSDRALARRALDTYLRDRGDEARQLAQKLSPAGRGLMQVLLDSRPSSQLSGLIERAVDGARPQLLAASPAGKLSALRVPVLLVHGQGDPIIPSIETRYLARDVPQPHLRQAVITPLLRHTDFPEPPKLSEAYALVRFIRAIFELAGSAR
jgi:pimeloyl-ACP methyl ester carboxylesterase